MTRALRGSGLVGLLAATLLVVAAGAHGGTGDWRGFGRTPDQNRHSPLTQVTPANVAQLQRDYTVDFRAIDATIKNGEQSYPLEIGGVLYLTTNDDNVWAVKATTGKVLWRFQPPNIALFKNFGIVANRGVAYCDGKLFLTTLDMHIDALSPRDGHLIRSVPIAAAVPGAASNLGYSETSAPVCADHVLVVGAAGSEYGVRGFVMGYHTDLTPAWANPYWTIPPEQTEWRKKGRLVGGGVNWTPQTIDTSTGTLYFGTGSATPLYYPALRPGSNPRTDSLIALDLHTGRQKWWQQQMGLNEWSYDTAQPPLVYDARIGGHVRRVVSVATMEGVWFAYDAKTGQPLYQRVKVIDHVEHPPLRPGQPVVVYPSSLGGVNYSPASYDPATGYVINAAAETAAVEEQTTLTPTQLARKLVGDVFLGLENGNFGTMLPGWHDHGSISAIDVATGRRVWKIGTPEPERGGVTTTASGLGFAGGGDGLLRAFATKTGKVLWTFDTGAPIAAGPTLFSVGGHEYVAITVGGTPTSSNGGVAAKLMVFSLGGTTHARRIVSAPAPVTARPAQPARRPLAARGATAAPGPARIALDTQRITVRGWTPASNDTVAVGGRLLLRGKPVAGARIRVDSYVLPGSTGRDGRFSYPADFTLPRRHLVSVAAASSARVGGRPLTGAERNAVLRAKGSFAVAYAVSRLHARVGAGGKVIVTGRLANTTGVAPPPVVLYTYRLTGRITDAAGRPVAGAFVVTRTQDRNFWTFSQPSDANGEYRSYYTASDQAGKDPVPLNMQVTLGKVAYGAPLGVTVSFKALRSASVDFKLPASPDGNLVPSSPSTAPGAIYEGLLVGFQGPRGVIVPVGGNWPDRQGNFRVVLPPSARGKRVGLFEDTRQVFATTAAPGAPVVAGAWPHGLAQDVPQRLVSIQLPR
jgi:PQQ-dependent dehydrogenase (methanol/ethanol family)